ncbi:MAG TPA: hypothetical protein VN914_22275, partial [Polyangia bacterium]|nr:hypothetical protein [Polyangia bacterium]
ADLRERWRPGREALWQAHLKILRPHLDASQVALLSELDGQFSPAACQEADERLEQRQDPRRLIGIQPPTRYDDDLRERHPDGKAGLLGFYDRSIAFYREVVEVEGHVKLRPKLEAALKARAAVAARL